MDLPWGDERSRQFVTGVGLITTEGPFGPNLMSAEWTHHISYRPALIAVCVKADEATHANIHETKEFGVSLASADHNVASSVAGTYSGKDFDKLAALEELGYTFFPSREIRAPLVDGATANFECRLVDEIKLGSHTMFVGEVIRAEAHPERDPLIYHGGRYFKLGERIEKPPAEKLDAIRETLQRHARKAA